MLGLDVAVASKADRTLERIADAKRARLVRLEEIRERLAELRGRGLRENRCSACDGVMGEYLGTVALYVNRCRQCGAWNELTTTEPTTSTQ